MGTNGTNGSGFPDPTREYAKLGLFDARRIESTFRMHGGITKSLIAEFTKSLREREDYAFAIAKELEGKSFIVRNTVIVDRDAPEDSVGFTDEEDDEVQVAVSRVEMVDPTPAEVELAEPFPAERRIFCQTGPDGIGFWMGTEVVIEPIGTPQATEA